MIRLSLAAVLMAPLPALAQQAPTRAAPAAADPARAAAAKAVVDRLWPIGTYRRLMEGTMATMVDTVMDQMLAMKPSEVLPAAKGKLGGAEEKTMGAEIAAADPHFRERSRLTTKAMFDAMMPLMDKIEPDVRTSMAAIYARKFTTDELTAMNGFFATPAGQAYAREWMISFMDPEIVKGMQSFVPELMREMPGIMKKVEAATAHLPPVPKKARPENSGETK
ncbi:DUF2059 domain-containing protein [Sphingomonas mucosissima]|uniref:DUF2059 domain-containing protein n=1 Tax=Sphingomonas mucosissima TaxID=370959 RepID=A0A245ZJ96_9SPHN|nr:DUF2059 domain-containing protein [Sphingomonas mucosissima]OWK29796.1 hypothetical protein SPMU_22170 [Sphingomonas mucosissima]